MSFYSIADYTGDGSTTTFAVPFPYLAQSHVEVYIAGVLAVLTTDYTWPNAGQITLNSAAGMGVSVRIQRDTPKDAEQVTFTNGSQLIQDDLNNSALQLLYIQQETLDYTVETLSKITAVAASNGNVPTPVSPTDDNTVLKALNGTYTWSHNITLDSATVVTLSTTNVSASGNLTIGGMITTTGNVTGANFITPPGGLLSCSNATVGILTLTSGIFKSYPTSPASLMFEQVDTGGTPVTPSTANPQFRTLFTASSNRTLTVQWNDGSGWLPLMTLDNQGTSNAGRVLLNVGATPNTDAAVDLGTSTLRFRNLFISGGISVGSGPGNVTNVVTDVQWNTTVGRLQIKTAPALLVGAESAWTDTNVDGDYQNE